MARWPSRDKAVAAMHSSEAYAKIEPVLEHGLAICLYDQSAEDLGWLDEMRRLLRHSTGYRAEVNPRSLTGMPV